MAEPIKAAVADNASRLFMVKGFSIGFFYLAPIQRDQPLLLSRPYTGSMGFDFQCWSYKRRLLQKHFCNGAVDSIHLAWRS
jgi:hypothetical protein